MQRRLWPLSVTRPKSEGHDRTLGTTIVSYKCKWDPQVPFLQLCFKAYFLAAGLVAFFGAAALGEVALGAAGAGAATAGALRAVRCARRALISALSLSLRSVSLAMLALSLAMALAVLDTGAFLAGALAAGLAAFAAAYGFLRMDRVFGAVVFFAVAMGYLPFVVD